MQTRQQAFDSLKDLSRVKKDELTVLQKCFDAGATDRTAYTKGPVEIEGTFDYPLTIENGAGIVSGFDFFKIGAYLSKNPGMSFSIQGANGEKVSGCKVQKTSISCSSGEGIKLNSTVWGVNAQNLPDNVSTAAVIPPGPDTGPQYDDYEFGPITEDYGETDSSQSPPIGNNVSGTFQLVQIPMWDSVMIEGAPDGMYVTGFSIDIDNKLVRNYTMGTQASASPWGLNATSISANQRTITGTLTWQSDMNGNLQAIMGSGIRFLKIHIHNIGTITLPNCLWNAAPPKVAPGERMTAETSFTAMGGTGIFDAITISDVE